ncbi:MAG TPA: type II/IV secretion system protein [Planctomycetes bacterium]|nr:type II/IV secretion system protein [Planctomycetota bacterium]
MTTSSTSCGGKRSPARPPSMRPSPEPTWRRVSRGTMASSDQSSGRRLIGQILKDRGVLREGQIQEALAEQRKHGGLIGQHLVDLGHASATDIAAALAEQAGLGAVDLGRVEPTQEALDRVDATTARTFGVLPLSVRGGVLEVAIADPLNTAVLEDLAFTTGLEIRGAVADAERLAEKIRELYGEEESLEDAIAEAASAAVGDDAASAAQSAPVVRLLNSILHRAIADRASDVHFEVFPDELRIRYRVDGSLYEVEAPPAHLALPLIARIKVMSDLDIAETKMPQDGRIALSIDGRPVDLRVATIPGIAGEGAVLRVLDRSAVSLDLATLGLAQREIDLLEEATRLPHGIVLVTGPTGSGKTTTLYAMLNYASDDTRKIITVEDPVEYDIDGIVQVPINEEIGVTYPKVLRTVLRQDPDMILVGEIRDRETAQVAVEASLTGHTVFATVHTNDAPSAITRLVDLGLEPFLITATLELVVAQRLVRRICASCKSTFEPDEDFLRELGPDAELLRGHTLAFGKGCEDCFHTGYRGRTAISEIMRVDEAVRRAVVAEASTAEIRERAAEAGMRSLRRSGLDAVLAGVTTVEEVLHETMGTW